ncbi:hypothetical protein GCM10009118_16050 [Wandonia haliotis]|uniref:Uncharacterized protein n=1 Tax=Wandonia haliotis TaxID=574963 RepID=A0ABN1MPL9_9FLAO
MNKKQIERSHLERFISNKNFSEDIVKIEDNERPDFILKLKDNRLVSIEHTRLINPDLKKIEEHKDKIIKAAQKIFESKYGEKLYVLITFNNITLQSGKKNEDKYINHVFELVEDVYLKNKGFEFHISSKMNRPAISSLIDSIWIDNSWEFSNWQHFGAYLVEQIDNDWFRGVIDKKERNIKHYNEVFQENWLLMVSDFGSKSSSNSFSGFDFSEIITKFDRVYLFSFRADTITQVK